jgi:hypothetical protein
VRGTGHMRFFVPPSPGSLVPWLYTSTHTYIRACMHRYRIRKTHTKLDEGLHSLISGMQLHLFPHGWMGKGLIGYVWRSLGRNGQSGDDGSLSHRKCSSVSGMAFAPLGNRSRTPCARANNARVIQLSSVRLGMLSSHGRMTADGCDGNQVSGSTDIHRGRGGYIRQVRSARKTCH